MLAVCQEFAEPLGQQGHIPFAAEHGQKAERAFEHGVGRGKAVIRKARGQDPALRRAAEMQPLDHAAIAGAGEFEEP